MLPSFCCCCSPPSPCCVCCFVPCLAATTNVFQAFVRPVWLPSTQHYHVFPVSGQGSCLRHPMPLVDVGASHLNCERLVRVCRKTGGYNGHTPSCPCGHQTGKVAGCLESHPHMEATLPPRACHTCPHHHTTMLHRPRSICGQSRRAAHTPSCSHGWCPGDCCRAHPLQHTGSKSPHKVVDSRTSSTRDQYGTSCSLTPKCGCV